MIKTPVPIFGFPSIEEFKVYLDKKLLQRAACYFAEE